MAISQKIYTGKIDACGAGSFVYQRDENSNVVFYNGNPVDITPQEMLAKFRALYDVQLVEGGPWKKSWCDEYTRRNETEEQIDAQLEENAT